MEAGRACGGLSSCLQKYAPYVAVVGSAAFNTSLMSPLIFQRFKAMLPCCLSFLITARRKKSYSKNLNLSTFIAFIMSLSRFFISNERAEHYNRLGTMLINSDDWTSDELQIQRYEVPLFLMTSWERQRVDTVTAKIFNVEEIHGYTPYVVKADGSCLFNALSLALFATQAYSYEFRIRLCVYMYENPNLLSIDNLSNLYGRPLTDDDVSMVLQSSISPKDYDADDRITTIKNRAKTMLQYKEYGSIIEIIYLSYMLNIEIEVIYPPKKNLFTRKVNFSGTLKPSAPIKHIILAWTHTNNTETLQGKWVPNHFVPCCQSNVKLQSCGESSNDEVKGTGLISKIKRKVETISEDGASAIPKAKLNKVASDTRDTVKETELIPEQKSKKETKRKSRKRQKTSTQAIVSDVCIDNGDGGGDNKEVKSESNQQTDSGRFNPSWCIEFDYVRPSTRKEERELYFYCSVCLKDVRCSHQGRGDASRHAIGTRHIEKKRQLTTQSSMNIYLETGQKTLPHKVLRAECMLTNYFAQHNLPFRAAEHLQRVLKAAISDSEIVKSYHCSRTKTTQVTKAMATYHKMELVELMKVAPFSIAVDGSNDNGLTKMYPINVKIFEANRSTSRFLDICALEGRDNSTAEAIYDVVRDRLTVVSDENPWANCVALGVDNTNVNVGSHNSLKSRLLKENDTVYIQGCPCHIIHNTARHGAAQMAKAGYFDLEQFLTDLYFHLEGSSKKKNILKEFTMDCEIEYRKIIKFVSTRWLCIGRCVTRTIEMFKALKAYILSEGDEDERGRLGRLIKQFRDPLTESYLFFYDFIIKKFERSNMLFQRDEPAIHILDSSFTTLMEEILFCFLDASYVSKPSNIADIDLDAAKMVYLPDKDVQVGVMTRLQLGSLHLTTSEERGFIHAAITFLLSAAKYGLKWFPLNDPFLKNAQFVDVKSRQSAHLDQVMFFATRYHTILNPEGETDYLDGLAMELIRFKLLSDEELGDGRIDEIWCRVGQMTKGHIKPFKLLAAVAKLVLVVPHSNAAEERMFSQTKKNLTSERNSLDLDTTLNSIMILKNTPGLEPCDQFDPPQELMAMAKKATKAYNDLH